MKILKLFKKPLFLVSTILLVSLLAVSAFALADAISMQTDFGGTVQSYQVGMQGKINLKLIYDDITKGMDDVDDYYKVTVEGREEYLSYPVSELKKQKNANVISVSLQVTEMNKKVTVTPVKVDSETKAETESGNIAEFSVKHYADRVLGNAGFAGYHDSMRALLNWGAKSETYFKTSGTTADGVFARDTDPVNAVGVDSISAPVHTTEIATTGEKFDVAASKLSLVLKDGNVSLCFKLKSTNTAPTLSATLQREDWSDSVDVTAYRNSDGQYVIQVDSITTSLFSKLYTVNISDGDSTMVTQGSVLEVLDKIIEGKDVDSSKPAEQKETAQALYQFYQLTTNNTGASGCYHGSAGTYCVDNGTNDTLKCSKCFSAIKDLPDSVTVYVPAGSMSARDLAAWVDSEVKTETYKTYPWVSVTHFNMISESVSTSNGSQYFSYTMGNALKDDGVTPYVESQLIWNRDENGGRSAPHEVFVNDVGNAEYLVVKLRVSENVDTILNVVLSTVGEDRTTASIPIKSKGEGEWVTYVLPIEDVFGEACDTNELGVYDIDTFYFHLTDPTGKPTVDIQYFAFAEDWSGVAAIVDQEDVVKSTNKSGTQYGYFDATTGECVKHIYYEGGVQRCKHCEYQDPVERYLTPELIRDHTNVAGTMDREVIEEDDLKFVRIKNNKVGTGNWSGITFVENGNTQIKGQYLIMKVRVGANGLNQKTLGFYTTTETGSAWEKGSVNFKISEDNQWHTVVIDLSQRVAAGYFKENDSGEYVAKYLQIRPFTGVQSKTQSDDYMDIAYIAMVDSLEDIKLVVDETTYEKSIRKLYNHGIVTETNLCKDDAHLNKGCDEFCDYCGKDEMKAGGHVLDSYTSADVEGNTVWTASCSLCDFTHKTTVPAGTNFYGDLSMMGYYTGNDSEIFRYEYDNATGVVYNKITTSSGTHVNITGGTGSGSATSDSFVIGKYLIMKYRTPTGNNVTIGSGSGIGVTNAGKVNHGANKSVNWQVAVISMQSLIDAGTIPTTASTFYLSLLASNELDIAYVATVDDLDEMKALVTDNTYVYYDTNFSSTPIIRCINHTTTYDKLVVTDGEGENEGKKIYAFECTVCGENASEHIIPASVTAYMSAKHLAHTAGKTDPLYIAQHYNTVEGNAQSPEKKFKYDDENDIAYYGGTSNATTQLIWTREAYSDKYPFGVGEATHMVFKMRVSNYSGDMYIQFSSTGSTDKEVKNIKIPLGSNAKGSNGTGWIVYVVDLETILGSTVYKKVDNAYTIDTFYFHMDGVTANSTTIDLAYIAFLKKGDNSTSVWNDIDELVKEDTIVNIADLNKSYNDLYTNGDCHTHTVPASGVSTETVSEGMRYYYVCSRCGEEFNSHIVPTSISRYAPADWVVSNLKLFTGSKSSKVIKMESGTYYASLSGSQEIAWARANEDTYADQRYTHVNPFDIGNSRYLVIKVRTDVALDLSMTYSTVGSNANDDAVTFSTAQGALDAGFANNKCFYNISENYKVYWLHDGVIYTTRTEEKKTDGTSYDPKRYIYSGAVEDGTVTFTAVPKSTGKGGFRLPLASYAVNEWQVYVMDLTKIVSEYDKTKYVHAKADGAESYVVDFLYGISGSGYSNRTLDIEYLAFTENWSDIDGLVEETEVVNITNLSGGHEIVTVADKVAAESAQ